MPTTSTFSVAVEGNKSTQKKFVTSASESAPSVEVWKDKVTRSRGADQRSPDMTTVTAP